MTYFSKKKGLEITSKKDIDPNAYYVGGWLHNVTTATGENATSLLGELRRKNKISWIPGPTNGMGYAYKGAVPIESITWGIRDQIESKC